MNIFKNFYYRKQDRKIILALLIFASVCICLIVLLGYDENTTAYDETEGKDSVMAEKNYRNRYSKKNEHTTVYYADDTQHKTELFAFDPNTADSTALLRLGLQPWQVKNIYRYRANGGVYRKPTDFAKLYGLTVKQYRQLEPYIHISDDYLPASTLVNEERYERDTTRYPRKIKSGEHIALNTADTAALKRIPGIGSYYANTIIMYGKRLGGYVSIDQLDEIEGFPKEAKQFFVLGKTETRRMNVNRMSLSELRRHPYMGFYRARTITEYRRLHGRINSLDELSLSEYFPQEAIERLRPYVEY